MSPYLWMLCGAVSFAVMAALASSLREVFPWQVIAIGRSTVPFVVISFIARCVRLRLPLWRPRVLWLRSLAGSLSLLCTFFALTRLPSSDVLTLTNVFPVWMALASWPLFGQRPTFGTWSCIAVALTGVVLLLRPHFAEGNLATLSALAASLTSTVALLGLHHLQQLDARGIVWHFSGVSLLFCLASLSLFDIAPRGAETLGPMHWLKLAGVGTSALLGQYCLTQAFTRGHPTRVSVVGLTQVGFVMLLEIAFVGRAYDGFTLAGMLLVLAPTAWLLLHPAGVTELEH